MMKGSTIEGGGVISRRKGLARGLPIMDFILRIVAAVGTLAAAIAMGTTDETLPFATQFIRFRAEFDDLPSFVFFVVAKSLICGYLVLSLILSLLHIVKSSAVKSRLLLVVLDTIMLGLATAGASAAAAIVYIAHYGNPKPNWFAICQQYNSFCERISASLIGAYLAAAILVILIIFSAVAISRN
ncbi:casparian strip membrane protein 1-like [Arachis stenosperma]|uniref:casparian strip membrane protein 1-like n=1 Tax=Arachis stenosperma TaxID=217475 RepID=UPI0025ACDAF6|nr:casparian strip membrane protein 1-like [Arachis stenosperma]